ncbi:hypothetical protein [Croceitalea dokdonensis]|nr:hypothetical protein [Croceitalea dokdonensis]
MSKGLIRKSGQMGNKQPRRRPPNGNIIMFSILMLMVAFYLIYVNLIVV